MIRADLIAACHEIGQCTPLWTQGAGGNVSLKEWASDQDYLWIKSSGTRLDQADRPKGIAKVRLSTLKSSLEQINGNPDNPEEQYSQALVKCSFMDPGFGRPSMETGFHALLPKRWVFHFHSIPSVLMAHEFKTQPSGWNEWLNRQKQLSISVLPSEMPGLMLSRQIAADPGFDVYILENHGIILQADSTAMLSTWKEIEESFCKEFGYSKLLEPLEAAFPDLPAPLKLCLPDLVVYQNRVLNVLIPSEASKDFFHLSPNASLVDLDACELWRANQILFQLCPALEELPARITHVIGGLPTEKFRKDKSQ